MRISKLGWLILTVVILGCGDGGGEPNPTTYKLAKPSSGSGEGQSGIVGQQLATSFCALVTQAGTPQPDVAISWSAGSNGGSMAPAMSNTNTNGLSCSRMTFGPTSGTQMAHAKLPGASGSPILYTATATPDLPVNLTLLDGDGQTAYPNNPLLEQLGVKVSDQFLNGVSGVSVDWQVTQGSATVNPSSSITDQQGFAFATASVGGTPGSLSITATNVLLSGSPIQFTATSIVPPPPGSTVAVTVDNNFFQSLRNHSQHPAVDTLAVGGTVTWKWRSNILHYVCLDPADDCYARSHVGQTVQVRFYNAGTYQYFCERHPGMTGTILVR